MAQNFLVALLIFAAVHCAVANLCPSGTGDALRINVECGEEPSGVQVSWEGNSLNVNLIYIEYSCRRLSASDEQQEREILVSGSYSLLGQENITIPEGETRECTIHACYLDDEFDLIGTQPVTATCGATPAPDTEPTAGVTPTTVPPPTSVPKYCPSGIPTGDALTINTNCGEGDSGLQVSWEGDSSSVIHLAYIEYSCRRLSTTDEQQDQDILVSNSNSLLGQETITIPEGETRECTIHACYLDDEFDMIGTQPVTATCGATPAPDTEPTAGVTPTTVPPPTSVPKYCPSGIPTGDALTINTDCGEGDSGLQVKWEGDSSSVIYLIYYIEYSCRRLSTTDEQQEQEILVSNSNSLLGQENITIPEGETRECTIHACYLDDEFDLIGTQPVTATCGATPDTEPTADVASITVPSPPSDTDVDRRRSASVVVRGIPLSINEEDQELPSSSVVTSVTGTFVISAVSIAVALVTCLGM